MIVYRPLKKQDIKQIQKLALESWLFTYGKIYKEKTIRRNVADYYSDKSFADYFSKIKHNNQCFIVAADKNTILGYAHIGKKKKSWEILRIYVSPKRLGEGIGTNLIKNIEKFLKSKEAKNYAAYPHIKNKIAKNFYSKIGFQRKKSKDRGKSSICYEKNI